jgi:hypothetical protein
MYPPNVFDRLFSHAASGRRTRRCLMPAVRPLEGRRLLSGGLTPTATMTQSATYPNLEALPNVATSAFLYFSSTMGTFLQ